MAQLGAAALAALAALLLATGAAAVRPPAGAGSAALHAVPSSAHAHDGAAAAGHEDAAVAGGESWKRPWFCHDLECPQYTVVNVTEDYEVRYYEAGVWVSTDVEAYAYALAANTGFRRLFAYIEGANEEAVKIPMTAPVRTRIAAAAGPFCKNAFTVSFYLPPRLHAHPPKPNNPDVYIDASPALTAFVAQKGGFVMDDWSVSALARDLADALDGAGQAYEAESFYLAGYDPPFRLTGRHTEAWLLARDRA